MRPADKGGGITVEPEKVWWRMGKEELRDETTFKKVDKLGINLKISKVESKLKEGTVKNLQACIKSNQISRRSLTPPEVIGSILRKNNSTKIVRVFQDSLQPVRGTGRIFRLYV